MVAWIYPKGTSDFPGIAGKVSYGTDSNGYELGMGWAAAGSGDKVYGTLDDASSYQEGVGSTSMSLNTWHHIALTWDGTTMKLYLDGAQDYSGSQTITPTPASSTFLVGKAGDWYRIFNGKIDEVRVYNRALPVGEVSTLYNSGSGCSGP